jgi:hypothetical protein
MTTKEMEMKLGTETGSLMNHVFSGYNDVPAVGMGATILMWSDREPATIIEVNEKKRYIVVQEDNAKRIDTNGMSESQDYEYSPNPEGSKRIYRKMKNGRWQEHYINPETGRLVKGGGYLSIGDREKYHDFSF